MGNHEVTYLASKYAHIKIPMSLAEKMDELVGHYGFSTRAEIAREGIRRLLLTFNKQANPKKED